MYRLTSTSMLIRIDVVTAATLHIHGSWADIVRSSGAYAPGGVTNEIKSDTGEFTMIPSPAATEDRTPRVIFIKNKHASITAVFRIEHTDGTDVVEIGIGTINLAPDESLLLNGDGTWFKFDASGGVYMGQAAASDTVPGLIEIASQAEMEAASDLTRAVVPGRLHFHPGHPKFWARTTVSAGAPTLQQSYNVTSITDTATGRLLVTIATDFSGVNYALVTAVERSSTTTTVASARDDDIRNATPAAGTFEHECWDHAATNNALADPSTWYSAGLGDQ